MRELYERDVLVSSTLVDSTCHMSLFQADMLLQDAMTELFWSYGCDAVRLSRDCGAVWAVARSKLIFDRMPFWMDRIHLRVFPVKVTPVSVHVDLLLEALDGTSLIRGKQELCAVDVHGHGLRRVDTTTFPRDLALLPPAVTVPFRRKKVALGEEDLRLRHIVRYSDTDMNRHMNNVAYVRLLLDAFPAAFWTERDVEEFDIQYVSECLEGETLDVLARQEGDEVDVLMQTAGRICVKAFLKRK